MIVGMVVSAGDMTFQIVEDFADCDSAVASMVDYLNTDLDGDTHVDFVLVTSLNEEDADFAQKVETKLDWVLVGRVKPFGTA